VFRSQPRPQCGAVVESAVWLQSEMLKGFRLKDERNEQRDGRARTRKNLQYFGIPRAFMVDCYRRPRSGGFVVVRALGAF